MPSNWGETEEAAAAAAAVPAFETVSVVQKDED
jgi:hypothetical protein